MIGISVSLVGVITFLIGFFFMGKANGLRECNNKTDEETGPPYKGGMAGVVMGLFLVIIGVVVMFWPTQSTDADI